MQTVWLAVLAAVMVARYMAVYRHAPLGPGNPDAANAWFGWADQAAYYLATRGWATLDLSSSQHLYPAGYPLLVAPFYRLFPGEPFAVPDLLLWACSMCLFAGLGARLLAGVPGARALAGTLFALAEVADTRVLYTWEVPWSSTPAAALALAALLLAVRQIEFPQVWRGFAAAACAGLIVPVRPTDALVLVPATGLALMAGLRRHRRLTPPVLAGVAAAFALGPLLFGATHLLTHGWTLGRYLETSRLIGFEPRLLPLRWVTLVLGPTPLYQTGEGLAAVYPYVLPGLAGILVAVAADRGRRLAHAVVGGSAVAVLCLYLCYRDLQVMGLFVIGNQHYFKWALPLFALYALVLPVVTWQRRCWAVTAGAMAVVLVLALWRPVPVLATLHASVLPDGSGLVLPEGLPRVTDRLDVPAPDDFLRVYYGAHTIEGPHRPYQAGIDFKLVPIPFGLSVIPMRPLPGPTVLHLASPLRLDPGSAVVGVRQSVVFGIPCAVWPSRPVCRYLPTLAPGRGLGTPR